MSLQTDHKVLMFVGAIAVLGAGVRVVGAVTGRAPVVAQPALDHQISSADSASSATHTKHTRQAQDTTRRKKKTRADTTSPKPERQGYVNGRLDLDVATAAQIDSLPGVTPIMAKRIVVDRMLRGPFLNRDGLRRVIGVGPAFLATIDSLVAFSGSFVYPTPADTIIIPKRRRR